MRRTHEIDYVSWAGDLAYGLGIFAFVFAAIGVFTPAWVDHHIDVEDTKVTFGLPDSALRNKSRIVGRGFFQAYEFNGFGVVTLVPYLLSDDMGSLDPFCGPRNVTSSLPVLQTISAIDDPVIGTRDRRYNSGDWCTRRETAAAFTIISLIFGLVAVFSTVGAQKGWCSQTPYIISIILVFGFALIGTSIMGAYIDEEQSRVNDQAIQDRFLPFKQSIRPGYSFGLYILGLLLYAAALLLAIMERCCCNKDEVGGAEKRESDA
ncbi:hypothetical protein PTSG_05621 [Salpingoeca rosetta]|uniref:Uncharacterized protein n=1 Tax=Salpingoeca rosetta (strain ATCC 50818 / BSB-021) TaxID=946362 RepID=F2UBQ9_SALR5|nr:uncharacterized protein PTSG_05621 [Salpingoeca rosetta]EGD73925.1 hypothetical protein PTSG_05621 [Salpingoeca rosetta]|eukprot:XP_004993488.1 hypothetical protein PTSG_05621 [Salpingoeca rosetta]